MKSTLHLALLCSFLNICCLTASSSPSNNDGNQAEEWMELQPVRFAENKGQISDMDGFPVPFVLFRADVPGLQAYITEKGLTYAFTKTVKIIEELPQHYEHPSLAHRAKKTVKWSRIDMTLKEAIIKKENIITEGPSATDNNFFYPHCPDGIYGVKEYEKITVKEVYPGIDWVLYGAEKTGFKYDFVVHPGADPNNIRLIYSSQNELVLDSKGIIQIKTPYGELTESAPLSFLEGNLIPSNFRAIASEQNNKEGYDVTVSFEFPHNQFPTLNSTLVIDPALNWATLCGGTSADGFKAVAIDGSGNFFVTGYAGDANFPVQNAGTYFVGSSPGSNVSLFISKFSPGGVLAWSTFYGGTGFEFGEDIICDASGNVLVTGYTNSSDFPVQNSGTFFQVANAGGNDAFLLKFDNSGNRLWATYYGGAGDDRGRHFAIDASGNIFLTGWTSSTNFPTQNAGTFFQGTNGGGFFDVFILKFTNAGVRQWATYYGGSAGDVSTSIACDNSGNVFVTGYTGSTNFPVQNAGTFFQGVKAANDDVFLLKFSNTGVRLWATYYGGNSFDNGGSIACDANGNVFTSGYTQSTNFPVQNAGTFFQSSNGGMRDGYILKFDNIGNRLWATYFGGSGLEGLSAFGDVGASFDNVVVDTCGAVYITFETESTNMPVQAPWGGGYFDNSHNGGTIDGFITRFTNSGDLLWATYFGGNGADYRTPIALDKNNNLFMAGEWTQNAINLATYPLTNPGGGAYFDNTFNGGIDDGYVAKFLNDTACPPPALLPIELLVFDALPNGSNWQVRCEWVTAAEKNNQYFTVERAAPSEEALEWKAMGTVAGAGNSARMRPYNFLDTQPLDGINYYRLKQTDIDGRYTYSHIVAVEMHASTALTGSIYPNPAIDHFVIPTASDEAFIVNVYDALGRLVLQREIEAMGQNRVDVSGLEAGIYSVVAGQQAVKLTIGR